MTTNITVTELRKAVDKIDPAKLYTAKDIKTMGLVLNSDFVFTRAYLYKILKRSELKSTNLGTEDKPRHVFLGKDLIAYAEKRYPLAASK